MKPRRSSDPIAYGGVLTTLTVVFQSAPIFIPTIGLFLSPFSSLSVAIAGIKSKSLGLLVFLASLFILPLISLEEAMIFLFTTGPLGLMIGRYLKRKTLLLAALFSGLALTLGILVMIYAIAFASLSSLPALPLVLLTFSFLYALLSCFMIDKLIQIPAIRNFL